MKVNNQSGFTILELMISTVVFSILLLGAATMMIQIGRLYYKGVVSSRTQEAVRSINDDIARSLQFGGEDVEVAVPLSIGTGDGPVVINAFCVGHVRYSYILNGQVNSSGSFDTFESGGALENNYVERALWRDEYPESCLTVNILDDSAIEDTENGKEMLGEGMRLYRFTAPTTSVNNLSTFQVGVVYGEDSDLIEFTKDGSGNLTGARCRGAGLGAQWCATSELSSTVLRRLKK